MPLAPSPAPLRLSSRPLLVAALALAAGIAAANGLPGGRAALAAVFALAGAAGLYAWATRRRLVTLRALAVGAAVVGGVAALGAARLDAFRTPRPDAIDRAARDASAESDALRGNEPDASAPVTVWGRVATVPTASEWSVRFVAVVDSAQRGTLAGQVSGRVQVALDVPQADAHAARPLAPPVYPALRLGDRVRLTGRLSAPPPRRNPADM